MERLGYSNRSIPLFYLQSPVSNLPSYFTPWIGRKASIRKPFVTTIKVLPS